MTTQQFDLLLTMLCGLRVALLGMVDAIEVVLVCSGRLKRRTSELRKELRQMVPCDIIES